jgi:hypothetical protein
MMKSGTGKATFSSFTALKTGGRTLIQTFILISVLTNIPQFNAYGVELCDGQSTTMMGGEYNVMNNIWGSCGGVGEQCIDVNTDSTYFQVTYSTHTGGCVASYPAVFKGCHWDWCTDNNDMPARIKDITSIPLDWNVTTAGVGGTWNASLDLWFTPNGVGTGYSLELMVWINSGGGAGPGGSQVATVTIGGTSWRVYWGGPSWHYVAYRRVNNSNTLNMDIKPFLADAAARGYISDTSYLEVIEAGFEIWSDGEGLTNNSFSTSVSSTTNIFPTVSITSPANGSTFNQGQNITIEADAADSDGSVTKVEFFRDSIKLGEDTTAPYSYTWNNAPVGYYILTAKATDDWNDITTSSAVNIQVIGGSGSILREWWTGIPGSEISDLTNNVNYPGNPTGRGLIVSFAGPTNWTDDYGTRIRGHLHPPTDGNYTFWIAGDDSGQLWLSTDDNPANASLIAYVPGSAQSSPISLAASQKYYIEALHKEDTGNDNISVSWQGPGISQQVIDGIYLSPCCLDLRDFSRFAPQWRLTGCTAGNLWCNGADANRDGSVQITDLKLFVEEWLDGIE